MGPQRRLGIYVGYESQSIIKYLEPSTGDLFTARFVDCHFDETHFPALGREKENGQRDKDICWNESSLSYLDTRTSKCEMEVQKIIHMQNLANRLPDSFTDPKRVTKSHVPAINAPIRIDVQEGQSTESKTRLKRGRPIGSKDKNPRKRKGTKHQDNEIEEIVTQDEFPDISDKGAPEELQVPDN